MDVCTLPGMTARSKALTAACALLFAVTGCSGGSVSPAAAPTPPALPKCSEMFKVGQKIDAEKAKAGCTDPDGGQQFAGSFRCNDGRRLWQVDASTGAAAGWGFGGDTYRATKAGKDPAYAKAYNACNS